MRRFCLLAVLAAGSSVVYAQCSPGNAFCISSLSPNSAPFTSCSVITVNGLGFSNGDTVQFVNGRSITPLATNFVSSTQLTAQVPSSISAAPGTFAVDVQAPGTFVASAPVTNSLPFALAGPAISQLTRSFGTAGGSAGTQIIVSGSNFVTSGNASCPASASLLDVGGSPASNVTVVNSSQLTATLPAMPVNPGPLAVTVLSGNTSSNTAIFTVDPGPSISALAPASCTVSTSPAAGCTNGALAVQISGTNFFGGAQLVNGVPNNQEAVYVDGAQAGFGTVGSQTQINMSVPQTVLTPGTHFVSVVTFDGVGSNRLPFVVNPAPVLTSAQPTAVSTGVASTLTLTGANFLSGMKVQWLGPSGGATLTPSTISATQIAVTVPSNLLATAGTATVAVLSADPIPVVSAALNISITSSTPLSIGTTSPLASGQLGVAYQPVQFQAAGGTAPYSWSATSVPAAMSFSTAGVLSGTPNSAGSFTISVTVTDSSKTTSSGRFAISIAGITITSSSLPSATAGTAYSGTLAATGGIGTLSWTAFGLPSGMTLSAAGAFGGTPGSAGSSQVTVTVTDSAGNTASQTYTLTVAPSPLTIAASGAIPSAIVGTTFSLPFTAAGGTPAYSFTATGLPVGLSVSAATGAISGTPTATGSSSVTITVTDSAGAKANVTVTINVGLPAAPTLNFTGISVNVNPASQSSVGVGLGSSYPVSITVNLTLTFSGTDPAVQFATGGTTATITIPAGQLAGATTVGVQTGTVAGTITVTAQLLAGAQNITPSPAPSSTIAVPSTAPVISAITATRTSGGFTVSITGFSSTRALSSANFTFNGTSLGTTSLSISVDPIFAPWYQSSTSSQYGSNFTYTQTFTTSNPQAVTSVSATLVNSAGTSAAQVANLQ